MKMKNGKNSIKKFFTKENIAFLSVALILCFGVAVSRINSSDIPLHDGDVLVDSAAVNTSEEDKNADFSVQRANIELERNELMGKCDETTKKELLKNMEKEIDCENVIKAGNLPDCLVIISDNRITVTVDDENLKQSTVAKICSIVMEETGEGAEKIVIQSKY